MLRINYFASVREAAGKSQESLDLPASVQNVADLIEFLSSRDDHGRAALSGDVPVLVAVDQTVVNRDHRLGGDEEVAFFPPMTGG